MSFWRNLWRATPIGAIVTAIQRSNDNGGSSAPAPAPKVDPAAGRLDQETMDEAAKKRMARLGKYFTSPLGALDAANTGSAKVFS